MKIPSWKNLAVYEEAFALQQQIFQLSKRWPKEETFSLTDQVRRSSRSIGSNLAEGWAKRRYPSHFLAKLTDADGELQETQHWLLTAEACNYIDKNDFETLTQSMVSIGRRLGTMMQKHETFCIKT